MVISVSAFNTEIGISANRVWHGWRVNGKWKLFIGLGNPRNKTSTKSNIFLKSSTRHFGGREPHTIASRMTCYMSLAVGQYAKLWWILLGSGRASERIAFHGYIASRTEAIAPISIFGIASSYFYQRLPKNYQSIKARYWRYLLCGREGDFGW